MDSTYLDVTQALNHYQIWIELAGGLAALIGVFLILWQIHSNGELNRKKTSQEILVSLVIGEFVGTIDEIVEQYDWEIIQSRTRYEEVVSALCTAESQDRVQLLNAKLRKILRVLEAVCISMQHRIVDENMCRDYLFSILIRVQENCSGFIEAERVLRDERRVFEHLEHYARRWRHERDQNQGPQATAVHCPALREARA